MSNAPSLSHLICFVRSHIGQNQGFETDFDDKDDVPT